MEKKDNKFIELLINLIRQFFETLFLIIRLLSERLLKPLWILTFLLIILIFKNSVSIFKVLSSFGLPEYSLIKDYLGIFLSLPTAVLVLGLIFLIKYSLSIKKFLENSRITQVGPLGVGTEQSTTPLIREEINTTISSRESYSQRSERFEFAYLNLALVPNTKETLVRLCLQLSNSSTKINLLNTINLPPEVTNILIEKEAIFSALLSNGLIEENHGLINATEKGKKFLRFLDYNIPT